MPTNMAKPADDQTIAGRFNHLDSVRSLKLERSRYMASLTLPTLLPPEGVTNTVEMPKPYSSVAARGVINMSSRMLSALIPLNDLPFFKFDMADGTEPNTEAFGYMEALANQVYNKLTTDNMRESIFMALQQLIVAGDVLLVMDDDYSFRVYRLDQYVVRRDIDGSVVEIIYLDWKPKNPNNSAYESYDNQFFPSSWNSMSGMPDYEAYFNRVVWNEDENTWDFWSEDSEGNKIDSGVFIASPFMALRWMGVTGEDYGRSHCEEILGDMETLEAYTKSMIDGMTAASTFWVAVDPAGITELDDIAESPNGAFVGARQQDVFTVSPAQTISPQLSACQTAVDGMRREVGNAFLLGSAGVRQAERVTATEVRMMGMEIENVLGGAFSSIARSLLQPIIRRTITLMIKDGLIDDRLAAELTIDGQLSVNVVTGLQALSRDADLTKLMQMGEMVRNLPPEAVQSFKWTEYASSLISAIGFDPRNWVASEEEQQQKQAQQQQEAMQMQAQGAVSQGVAQGVGQAAQTGITEAAMQMMGGQANPAAPPM